jgi:protoheme IX farnesyltransferase
VISTFNTLLGAVPGALPPMIGWAAARGTLDAGAWMLFAILFFWQLPHFFAIAWMYRDDYARAGFQMISSDDATGARSASQSVFFCMILFVVAGLPAFIRMATVFYLLAAWVLGGLFIVMAMRFLKTRTRNDARRLFITSVIYLPLLLGALVLCKA